MASLKPGKPGKQKTKSAAKKRFKQTGTGKWMNDKVAHKHLLLQKSTRQKNEASKPQEVAKSDVKAINRMMAS